MKLSIIQFTAQSKRSGVVTDFGPVYLEFFNRDWEETLKYDLSFKIPLYDMVEGSFGSLTYTETFATEFNVWVISNNLSPGVYDFYTVIDSFAAIDILKEHFVPFEATTRNRGPFKMVINDKECTGLLPNLDVVLFDGYYCRGNMFLFDTTSNEDVIQCTVEQQYQDTYHLKVKKDLGRIYPRICVHDLIMPYLYNVYVVGHNYKYDSGMAKLDQGIQLPPGYTDDTVVLLYMVENGMSGDDGTEEKDLQKGKKKAYAAYNALVERMLGLKLSKDTRSDFINAPIDMVLTESHIKYLVKDLVYLLPIYQLLLQFIQNYQLDKMHNNFKTLGKYPFDGGMWEINRILVDVYRDAETQGLTLNAERFMLNYTQHKTAADKVKYTLDDIFRKRYIELRNHPDLPKSIKDEMLELAGENYQSPRREAAIISQTDIFGNVLTPEMVYGKKGALKAQGTANNIDWTDDRIKKVCAILRWRVPTTKHNLFIPIVKRNFDGTPDTSIKGISKYDYYGEDNTVCKFRINPASGKFVEQFSMNQKDMKNALVGHTPDEPDSGILFMFTALELKEHDGILDKYGPGFLDKFVNKRTGLVYTKYKINAARNHRSTSGDNDHGYINALNITNDPRPDGEPDSIKACFSVTWYNTEQAFTAWIGKTDLEGAELKILVQKAKDLDNIDLYSHDVAGTINFRIIYEELAKHAQTDEEASHYFHLSKTFEINKKLKLGLKERDKQKGGSFSIFYGARPPKVAQIYGIPLYAAKALHANAYKVFAKAMLMMDSVQQQVILNGGWIIVSPRTLLRVFDPLIVNKTKSVLGAWQKFLYKDNQFDYEEFYRLMTEGDDGWKITDRASKFRNIYISGEQACILYESLAWLYLYLYDNNISQYDIRLLLPVYDEIAYALSFTYNPKININAVKLTFIADSGEVFVMHFPSMVEYIMSMISRRYGFIINTESSLKETWHK